MLMGAASDSEGTSRWLKDAVAATRCVPISIVIVVIVVIMMMHAAAAAGAAALIAAEGFSALPLCCGLVSVNEISW